MWYTACLVDNYNLNIIFIRGQPSRTKMLINDWKEFNGEFSISIRSIFSYVPCSTWSSMLILSSSTATRQQESAPDHVQLRRVRSSCAWLIPGISETEISGSIKITYIMTWPLFSSGGQKDLMPGPGKLFKLDTQSHTTFAAALL